MGERGYWPRFGLTTKGRKIKESGWYYRDLIKEFLWRKCKFVLKNDIIHSSLSIWGRQASTEVRFNTFQIEIILVKRNTDKCRKSY